MKEKMKAVEEKNNGYGTFCKNILNGAYGKDGMNKSMYSKLVIMDQKKAFSSQCLPEFKSFRQILNSSFLKKTTRGIRLIVQSKSCNYTRQCEVLILQISLPLHLQMHRYMQN
jgi:hypothetical protein